MQPSGIVWVRTDKVVIFSASFSASQYADAHELVKFENTGDAPGTVPRTIAVVVNDGALDSAAAITTISVVASNDGPVHTVPGAQTAIEDTPLSIGGVSVADVDGGGLTTTLTMPLGTLSVAPVGGVVVVGSGTGSVSLTGTAAQINGALAGLTFQSAPDYYGPVNITMVTSDGSLIALDQLLLTVVPVADAVTDSAVFNQSGPFALNVLANDSFSGSPLISSINCRPILAGGFVDVGPGIVTLLVDGTITDGTFEEKSVRIETMSGDMTPLSSQRQGALPPTFAEQIGAFAKFNSQDIEVLATALRR